MTAQTSTQPATMTVRIPMRLARRGGRKVIIAPETVTPPPQRKRDERLIQAIVKAHRWRRRIESGKAKSITDLAAQEGVTDAFVCRMLTLTCLAPDLVAAILDGAQPDQLHVSTLLTSALLSWCAQQELCGFSASGPITTPGS